MPVSTMAMSASTRWSVPLIAATVEWRAPTRDTPVGVVWAVSSMSSSGTTAATVESVRMARRCCWVSCAA